MSLKNICKSFINGIAGKFGVRVVNAEWGPCGYFRTLQKIKENGFSPSQIIDIGAACGKWTSQCLNIFPKSDYFLTEPLMENMTKLKKLEQQHDNINIWMGALGTTQSTKNIYVHGDQSSFFKSEYSRYDKELARCVEVKTLDSILDEGTISPPDIIKMDVQGSELDVLKGSEKCLNNSELLLLEVSYRQIYKKSPLAHEIIAYVGSREYRIFDMCTYTMRPYDGALAQSDILFVKQSSKLWGYEGWG